MTQADMADRSHIDLIGSSGHIAPAMHDIATPPVEPLIVDPRGPLTAEQYAEVLRGPHSSPSRTAGGEPSQAEPPKVTPLALTQRFSSEGRWHEIQPVRDLMMRECRQKGMSKDEAHAWTYGELERLYPPLANGVSDSISGVGEADYAHAREGSIGQIPGDWPLIPDNAPLAAELAWVQSNRLRVVEGRSVHLDRAGSPAPSWASLGWLDTAICNPAKWADICARGLGQHELESDITKRERRSIAEVRELLTEMHAIK